MPPSVLRPERPARVPERRHDRSPRRHPEATGAAGPNGKTGTRAAAPPAAKPPTPPSPGSGKGGGKQRTASNEPSKQPTARSTRRDEATEGRTDAERPGGERKDDDAQRATRPQARARAKRDHEQETRQDPTKRGGTKRGETTRGEAEQGARQPRRPRRGAPRGTQRQGPLTARRSPGQPNRSPVWVRPAPRSAARPRARSPDGEHKKCAARS